MCQGETQPEVLVFENSAFGQIRVMTENGSRDEPIPWFVGKDVAVMLGYSNPQKAIRDHVDEEDRTVNESFTVHGTAPVIINESGLYSLILSSKLPEAKKFKRWITTDVLPAIRRHGAYMTAPTLTQVLKQPEIIYQMASKLTKEYERANRLEQDLQRIQPKAEHYDAFINCGSCTNLRTTAKQLQVPERAFIGFLLNQRLLYRSKKGHLLPYNRPETAGWFAVKDVRNGGFRCQQTMVTPFGKGKLREKWTELQLQSISSE